MNDLDFELDEAIEDDDQFIHDPYLDFDTSYDSMCLDCGALGSTDACQCCGGPLCHQCYECSAGFCDECPKLPDFDERMQAIMDEAFGVKEHLLEPEDIPF